MAEPDDAPTTIVFAPPPFAFNRKEALRYTRLAPKRFKQLEDAGASAGRREGTNGETIYLRTQLEATMLSLFGAAGAPKGKLLDEL